jgi:hypothetical protein
MKKLLTILASMGLVASSSLSVTAWTNDSTTKNVNLNKSLTKINPLANEDIDVPETATVAVGQTISIKIGNYDDLLNPNVRSQDPTSVDARLVRDSVELTGVEASLDPVNVIITADGVREALIAVTVNFLNEIIVNQKPIEIYAGGTATVQVENFTDLSGLNVTVVDPTVATAILNDQGLITITGLEVKNTKSTYVRIKADYATPVSIQLTVKEAKKINVDKNLVETYAGETATVQVENFNDLPGLNVTVDNTDIATATLDNQGLITVTGKKIEETKETKLIISADDAPSIEVTVTVKALIVIEIDTQPVNIYTGDMIELQIENYDNLSNLEVSTDKPGVARVGKDPIDKGIIISGISEGTATISITALHAETATIQVNVADLKTIEIEETKLATYVNGSVTALIKNYSDLQLVNVTVANPTVALVNYDSSQGLITVTGLNVGDTTITITAEKAQSVTIPVQILALETIDVDLTPISTYLDTPRTLAIKNFDKLQNIDVVSADPNVVETNYDSSQGLITVNGQSKGDTIITITAANANLVTISVKILDLLTILVPSSANTEVDSWTKLPIDNSSELEDIIVKSDDEQIASAIPMGNQIWIKGISKGNTTITVEAKHANPATIEVNVGLKKIQVNSENVIVYKKNKQQIAITNINTSNLTNIVVESLDSKIATVEFTDQGVITIAGEETGNTFIKITADQAEIKEIKVEVKALEKIQIDSANVTVYGSNPETVVINNIRGLINPKVTPDDQNKVNAVLNPITGVITITKAAGAEIGDTTTIWVKATNAEDAKIDVTIVDQLSLKTVLSVLAIDNVSKENVLTEVAKLYPEFGLKATDIKMKEGSFKAAATGGLKLGEVIIQSNSSKYIGEVKLLIAPTFDRDEKSIEILKRLEAEKDPVAKIAIWEEYFKYQGNVFFNTFMPANSWAFKTTDFEVDGSGNKKIKMNNLNEMSKYWDAIIQCLSRQDYNDHNIVRDYWRYGYSFYKNEITTTVTGNNVNIYVSGFYDFSWEGRPNVIVDFSGNILGTIVE